MVNGPIENNAGAPTTPNPVTAFNQAAYALLDRARREARKKYQYDSAGTRELVSSEVRTLCDGRNTYTWQLDTLEAVSADLDCVIQAGTGSGKTLPFVLPLLADSTGKSKVIIVSPLNELQKEQVRHPMMFSKYKAGSYLTLACRRRYLTRWDSPLPSEGDP